jgi:PAS domain S-box-containing protein
MRMSLYFLRKKQINRLIECYPNNSFICDSDGNIQAWHTTEPNWAKATHLAKLEGHLMPSLAQKLLSKTILSQNSEHIEQDTDTNSIELTCTPFTLLKKKQLFIFTIHAKQTACNSFPKLQEKLTQTYQTTYQLFFQIDRDYQLINYDTYFSELCIAHHPKIDQLVGKPLNEVLPPHLATHFMREASLSCEADLTTHSQISFSLGQHENIYTLKTIPIKLSTGETVGVIGLAQPIHPNSIETPFLKPNFESTLIANLPALVYWKDTQQKILGCNYEELNHFQESQSHPSKISLSNNTFYNKLEFQETEDIRKNDRQVLIEAKTLTFEELNNSNGKKNIYLSEKKPLIIDGKTIGISGVSLDISAYIEKIEKLKKNNETLKDDLVRLSNEGTKTEEHLNWIIDHLPGNIFWENKEGQFLGCNKHMLQWLGLSSKKELIGRNLLDISSNHQIDKESLIAARQNDLQVIQTKEDLIFEETILQGDKKVCFLSHKSPLMSGNECVGTIGVAMNITHQKDLEEKLRRANSLAENALQAKSDFIANISHDLRTPLHTLYGTAEQLENEMHLPTQEEKINTLLKCSQLILRLVDNVLHYSQLKDGTMQLHEKACDLEQLIDSLIVTFKPLAKSKKIALRIHTESIKNWYIYTDPNALSRILINLIQNAMKHTREGEVSLSLSEIPISESQSTYLFQVKDTGIGIPKEELTKIFSRFFQGEQHKGNGLGLGLSITQRFTEMMGGTITVDSEWGVGSTFTCTIPIALSDQKPEKITPFTQVAEKPRILLVEDNELIQTMTVQTLKKLDWKYELASTGEEALLAWRKGNISLILLDLGLPDQPGLNVLETIRKFDKHIPIITLTGDATEKTRKECFATGATDFLTKPASQEELLHAITKTLQET